MVSKFADVLDKALAKCEAFMWKHQDHPYAFTDREVVLVRRTVMLALVRNNLLRESSVYGLTVGEARSSR